MDYAGFDTSLLALVRNPVFSEFDPLKRDRGFVYFAWRSRPESYFYVGKAGSSSRVNLDAHGKLLESLKNDKASRLSFIFPAKSTPENIAYLEAALLNLIEFKTGELPEENTRREYFGLEYECGEDVRTIRKLLSQIGQKIE